jgi:NADH dehydrogenase
MRRMILISGGTGTLGSAIARRLLASGRRVVVMTRDTRRANDLRAAGAGLVAADLRHAGSLRGAMQGVTHVITTANSFTGRGDESVVAVDLQGTRNLIDVAREARVQQFIFASALLPDAYRSIDYFAAKFDNEEYLRRSGLAWTILRPTAFMETWAAMVGDPLAKGDPVRVFGSGRNPLNFVAVNDVAAVAAMTLDRGDALNNYVEIGGPENLTMLQLVDIFERVTGKKAKRTHVPVVAMRIMAPIAGRFNPVLGRMIRSGLLAATIPQPFDPAPMLARYPVTLTRLEDWARARYAPR